MAYTSVSTLLVLKDGDYQIMHKHTIYNIIISYTIYKIIGVAGENMFL